MNIIKYKLKYFLLLKILFLPAFLFSANWTPVDTVPQAVVDNNIQLTYNSSTQQIFGAWADPTSQTPFYATYTSSSGWSTPAAIDATAGASKDVSLACNPATGQVMATWVDLNGTNAPTYSLYTPGSGWSAAAPFVIRGSLSGIQDVFVVFNTSTQQFFAAWGDEATQNPAFSIYTAGLWSVPAFITTTSTTAHDVTLGFDSTTGGVFAAWGDSSNSSTPTYSIYTGSWSSAAPISNSSTTQHSVFMAFNASLNQMFAAWGDPALGQPVYATYNGSAWNAVSPIATGTTPYDDVILTYQSSSGELIAAWTDTDNQFHPTYSVFNSAWSAAQPISTAVQVCDNVTLAYDSAANQVLAAWQDSNTTNGFDWSVYEAALPPVPGVPLPPSKFFGKISRHHGKTVLAARWKKSHSSDVIAYEIYERKKLLKTITSSSTLRFKKKLHRHLSFKKAISKKYRKFLKKKYRIRAVNQAGQKSRFVNLRVK